MLDSKPLPSWIEDSDPEPYFVMLCLDQEEVDEWGRLLARAGMAMTITMLPSSRPDRLPQH